MEVGLPIFQSLHIPKWPTSKSNILGTFPQFLLLSQGSKLKLQLSSSALSLPAGSYLAFPIILLQWRWQGPHCTLHLKSLSINLTKFLGPAADWAWPCRNCVCLNLISVSVPGATPIAGTVWFQWDFFVREEAKSANGAVWSCIGFCKESPWKHPPGRCNEPRLAFSFFLSPFVDYLVCTRSL